MTMPNRKHIAHPFEPVADERSRVLLLGTMPSPRSREDGFYYGHPQNRFWKVLAALFDEPAPTTNERKRDLLLRHHIALWDVLSSCEIEGASDASIAHAEPNDIAGLIARTHIEAVYCTGSKAAELYAKLCEPACGLKATRLPSTSPANAACSFDELLEAYRAIMTHEHPFHPPAFDVPEVVALEKAIDASGTSLAELMSRAGRALAYRVHALDRMARVCVLCGSGNNGGDGWIAADELAQLGHEVTLVTSKAPDAIKAQPAADAALHVSGEWPFARAEDAFVYDCTTEARVSVSGNSDASGNRTSPATPEAALEQADIIIDAILGTGFDGDQVKDPYGNWIRIANKQRAHGARIVSADVPSGLSAHDGHAADPCIAADLVVTMIAPKPGLAYANCPVHVAPLAYIEPLLDGFAHQR